MVYYLLNHGAFDKVYSARHQFPPVDASNTIRKWVGYPYDSCVNTVLMDIQGALRRGRNCC